MPDGLVRRRESVAVTWSATIPKTRPGSPVALKTDERKTKEQEAPETKNQKRQGGGLS